MIRVIRRLWCSANYRFCMSNAYLASQRHETLVAIGWSQNAGDWLDKWRNGK